MDTLGVFNQHRPLLFSIAYNMLGSAMDAEDMVQEVYLRWMESAAVESPKAYLAAIVTNLCINHLQSAKVQREEYFGPWLPEPLVTEPNDPQQSAALAETLSMAFLVMLESCTPQERAALLLRQVFDYEYSEIAPMLGKSEAACRQLVSRAKQRITAQRHRAIAPVSTEHQQIVTQFLQACIIGDMPTLMKLLAVDCVLRSDGGGKASTAIYPVISADKVARFFIGVLKKAPAKSSARIMPVNGLPGIVGYVDGQPVLVIALQVVDRKIQNIYSILNPDKLQRVPALRVVKDE
jgi:RNA polymerase sigma-70 factor, ECF subfamily